MTDESSPRHPGSSDDANAGAPPEADLDAALVQAAALAEDLAAEIGEPPPIGLQVATKVEAPDAMASSTEQVEMELAELERLVDVASTEVKEPPAQKPRGTSHAVPDFMSEFTEPAPAPVDSPAATEESVAALDDMLAAKAAPPVVPKPPRDPKLGVVGTQTRSTGPEKTPGNETDDRQPGRFLRIASRLLGPIVRRIAELCDRLAPVAYVVCDRVVGVLERIDRPLGRLGLRVRRLAGWVAIATLGLSLLVFMYSLL